MWRVDDNKKKDFLDLFRIQDSGNGIIVFNVVQDILLNSIRSWESSGFDVLMDLNDRITDPDSLGVMFGCIWKSALEPQPE